MSDPDYFTLTEFRTLPEMDDTTKFPDARVLAAAGYITGIMEREIGTSFIARTVTDEVHDGGGYEVILTRPFVLSVTSATENSVSVTDTLSVSHNGLVQRYASGSTTPKGWLAGSRNLRVTYQAGYSATVPADIKEAAMRGTRAYLLETRDQAGVLDRRSQMTNDLGGSTTFVIAGSDHPTGYPQVDAVIVGWRDRLNCFLVA
jgi:hypothetical protein